MHTIIQIMEYWWITFIFIYFYLFYFEILYRGLWFKFSTNTWFISYLSSNKPLKLYHKIFIKAYIYIFEKHKKLAFLQDYFFQISRRVTTDGVHYTDGVIYMSKQTQSSVIDRKWE